MRNGLKVQLESAQGNFPDFKWGGKEEKHFWRSADRGFTLVEMIITVTILVILAAILVPSMVGWVDRAQGKSYAVEARAVYLAAQTIESEHYDDSGKIYLDLGLSTVMSNPKCEEIRTLSGVNLFAINIEEFSMDVGPVESHDIIKMRVQFIPKGKTDLEDAVIMKLEDGAWSKTDSMEDEGTGGDPTYDGDGE